MGAAAGAIGDRVANAYTPGGEFIWPALLFPQIGKNVNAEATEARNVNERQFANQFIALGQDAANQGDTGAVRANAEAIRQVGLANGDPAIGGQTGLGGVSPGVLIQSARLAEENIQFREAKRANRVAAIQKAGLDPSPFADLDDENQQRVLGEVLRQESALQTRIAGNKDAEQRSAKLSRRGAKRARRAKEQDRFVGNVERTYLQALEDATATRTTTEELVFNKVSGQDEIKVTKRALSADELLGVRNEAQEITRKIYGIVPGQRLTKEKFRAFQRTNKQAERNIAAGMSPREAITASMMEEFGALNALAIRPASVGGGSAGVSNFGILQNRQAVISDTVASIAVLNSMIDQGVEGAALIGENPSVAKEFIVKLLVNAGVPQKYISGLVDEISTRLKQQGL